MKKLPFGFDQPEDSPGFLLWQTSVLWQRAIKKVLEPTQLSHAQFVIMATLLWLDHHQDDVTQVDIIRLSKLDKMTVSKALKYLVAQRYVERVTHHADTRAKKISLTSAGKKIVTQLIPKIEKMDAVFFGKLSKLEQKKLIPFLKKLNS